MSESRKIIVTKDNNRIVCFHMINGEPVRLFLSKESDINIGDIFVGRVQTVKTDIKASFVEVQNGLIGFLPDTEINPSSLLNRVYDGRLKQGDLVAVMVNKEPVKTKPCSLTMNLSIQGSFSVVHNDSKTVTVSSKLPGKKREELKDLFKDINEDTSCGVILRTNAGEASIELVTKEIKTNLVLLHNLLSIMDKRTLYTCLYKSIPSYINQIRSVSSAEYDEIVTDNEALYEVIKDNISIEGKKFTLYKDENLSLKALYALEKAYNDATNSKVNLKSGGYIIIEPTEALTVIDVNSGKTNKRVKNEAIHLVNKEAASEIARQLMLRNISGMIIVDFINYDSSDKEYKDELIAYLKKLIARDYVKTNYIDMTPLGLVELTRQKKYASIYDELKK